MSFSSVVVHGRLTRNIEITYTAKGTAVTEVTVAIDTGWGDNKETAFVDCTLWGQKAETAQKYLQKGSPVCFTGELRQDRWEKDGQKRSKLRVNVNELHFVDQNKADREAQPAGAADDVPF